MRPTAPVLSVRGKTGSSRQRGLSCEGGRAAVGPGASWSCLWDPGKPWLWPASLRSSLSFQDLGVMLCVFTSAGFYVSD